VLRDIETLKTGISDSGVNLTQEGFLSLPITVPSIGDQKATISEFESTLSNIRNVEAEIENALSSNGLLRQAILKKAFSGQLVAQDPRDEPASVLLERLTADKDRSANGRKKNLNSKEAA